MTCECEITSGLDIGVILSGFRHWIKSWISTSDGCIENRAWMKSWSLTAAFSQKCFYIDAIEWWDEWVEPYIHGPPCMVSLVSISIRN